MGAIKSCISVKKNKYTRQSKANRGDDLTQKGFEGFFGVPDKAKLESARPPVRMATTSQGGNPRSTEDRVMQIAGDKNAIDWQIFRTLVLKNKKIRQAGRKLQLKSNLNVK